MTPSTARTLGVLRPGEPALFTDEVRPVRDGEVRIGTRFTGFSAGTELATVTGSSPFARKRWDRELRLFEDGPPHAGYPVRCLGYMEAGTVVESRVDALPVGTPVAAAYGHRTAYVADPRRELVVPVPPDLDPLLGVYAAQMGPICANGLLHAAAEAGEPDTLAGGVAGRRVLVTGGGTVGLLTALLAQEHGAAAVAVADATPERLAAAEALGCDPIPVTDEDPARWCKERWRHPDGDRGADVAFQCRAKPAALRAALRALRPQRTVIDLAFYTEPLSTESLSTGDTAAVMLGEEFHHNGLTLRCAQISRLPRGCSGWDRARLVAETLTLLRTRGAEIRKHVVTDVVPFDEAPAFIRELAARRRHAISAVFAVDPG